jgi:hypothetical protein
VLVLKKEIPFHPWPSRRLYARRPGLHCRDMFHPQQQRRSMLVLHNGPDAEADGRSQQHALSARRQQIMHSTSAKQRGKKCRTLILAGAEKQVTSISPSDRDKERKNRTGRLHHHSQGLSRAMPLQFSGYFIPKKKGKGRRVHSVSS